MPIPTSVLPFFTVQVAQTADAPGSLTCTAAGVAGPDGVSALDFAAMLQGTGSPEATTPPETVVANEKAPALMAPGKAPHAIGVTPFEGLTKPRFGFEALLAPSPDIGAAGYLWCPTRLVSPLQISGEKLANVGNLSSDAALKNDAPAETGSPNTPDISEAIVAELMAAAVACMPPPRTTPSVESGEDQEVSDDRQESLSEPTDPSADPLAVRVGRARYLPGSQTDSAPFSASPFRFKLEATSSQNLSLTRGHLIPGTSESVETASLSFESKDAQSDCAPLQDATALVSPATESSRDPANDVGSRFGAELKTSWETNATHTGPVSLSSVVASEVPVKNGDAGATREGPPSTVGLGIAPRSVHRPRQQGTHLPSSLPRNAMNGISQQSSRLIAARDSNGGLLTGVDSEQASLPRGSGHVTDAVPPDSLEFATVEPADGDASSSRSRENVNREVPLDTDATSRSAFSKSSVAIDAVSQASAGYEPAVPGTGLLPTSTREAAAANERVRAVTEKIAVERVDRRSLRTPDRESAGVSTKKDSQNYASHEIGILDANLGTETAIQGAPMLHDVRQTRLAPLTGESFSAVGGVDASTPGTARSPDSSSSVPIKASTAVQAIRQIADAADVLWATERSGVNLKLQLDDVGVAVRVEYRDGEVRATFHTYSSDLRDALARAWEFHASAVADQKPYRFAEPVFTSAPPSTPGGFSSGNPGFSAGGDSSRHSSHPGNPETPHTGSAGRSGESSAAPSPGASTSVSAAPSNNSQRLHVFA